jgi:hypothetical protein
MNRFRLCFGLFGLLSFAATAQAQAPAFWNVKINFSVEVKNPPPAVRPGAPWYMYFPVDPHLMKSPQVTPYPPFPGQFPPAPPSFDGQTNAPKQAYAPPGPMVTQFGAPAMNRAPTLQPVGFLPSQAPSYWYGSR